MTELVFGTSTGISRFPDATEEELRELDNTCIICREQLLTGKKLPCNHVFIHIVYGHGFKGSSHVRLVD